MAIAFPATPAVNDTYTYNGRDWIWNGEGWALNINAGQVSSAFKRVRDIVVTDIHEIDNADLTAAAWLHKVYI